MGTIRPTMNPVPNPVIRPTMNPILNPTTDGASKADLATAGKVKKAIQEQLKVVRFGNPLAAKDAPKTDREGTWKAPNGNLLFPVQLSKPPPAGSADFPTQFGLVDPKTNKFYEATGGGITGQTFFHGPLTLPGINFTGKTFGQKEIQQLAQAAAGKTPAPATKLPTKKAIENAIGAYNFQKLIKYTSKAPKDAEILGKVAISKDKFPDGFTYTALVLKKDPTKVIIQRTGGIAGLTQYSNALNTVNLPK